MTTWNQFRTALSRQYTTAGTREQADLYNVALNVARSQGLQGLSGEKLALLALEEAGLPILGREAPLFDDDELDDYEAPIPGPVFEAPASGPVFEAPAPPPDFGDSDSDYYDASEYSSALDDALNATDIDMRENLLRTIMEQRGITGLVGPLGRPLSMEKLLQMAQLQPIWADLSDDQKAAFLDSAGYLRDGKPYVSKRIVEKPLPIRRTLIQLADGTKLRI